MSCEFFLRVQTSNLKFIMVHIYSAGLIKLCKVAENIFKQYENETFKKY